MRPQGDLGGRRSSSTFILSISGKKFFGLESPKYLLVSRNYSGIPNQINFTSKSSFSERSGRGSRKSSKSAAEKTSISPAPLWAFIRTRNSTHVTDLDPVADFDGPFCEHDQSADEVARDILQAEPDADADSARKDGQRRITRQASKGSSRLSWTWWRNPKHWPIRETSS